MSKQKVIATIQIIDDRGQKVVSINANLYRITTCVEKFDYDSGCYKEIPSYSDEATTACAIYCYSVKGAEHSPL